MQGTYARFEEARVKSVLTKFKLLGRKFDLLKHYHDSTGEWWLNFSTFDEFFPTFPVRLSIGLYKRPFGTESCEFGCSSIFRGFKDSPLLSDYDMRESELQSASGEIPAIGIVFPYHSIRNGLVCHNVDSLHVGGVQVVQSTPGRATLFCCRFVDFLDAIARTWSPSSETRTEWHPAQSASGAQDPEHSNASPALLLQIVDSPSEAMLLSAVTSSVAAASAGLLRTTQINGERWLVAPQSEVATRLGLSERTVRSVIKILVRKGLIETCLKADPKSKKRVVHVRPCLENIRGMCDQFGLDL